MISFIPRLTPTLGALLSLSLHASVLGYWLYTPSQAPVTPQHEPLKIALRMIEKQQVPAPVTEKIAPKVTQQRQAAKPAPAATKQSTPAIITTQKPQANKQLSAPKTAKPAIKKPQQPTTNSKQPPAPKASQASVASSAASPNNTSERKVSTQQSTGKSTWESRAFAKLEKARRYPATALLKQQQGVVYIKASIGADGSVLKAELSRSSGMTILDNAALDTLYRAAPLPALPQDYPDPFMILLPIEFFMS